MNLSDKTQTFEDMAAEINRFIDSCRLQCLWHISERYYPETDEERVRILHYIESRGDLKLFQEAKRYQEWLSRNSSGTSAG